MVCKEKTVSKNYVYKGKILNLRVDDAIALGKSVKREVIEHSGGSAILCVKDRSVLLIRQYRYPYDEIIWEIPAGKLNPNEDPKTTAFRELEEECGIKAEKMELLFNVYPSVGYTDEVIRIYKAETFTKTHTNFDEDEEIESFWVPFEKVKEMIESGEIKDSKTLIALLSLFKN